MSEVRRNVTRDLANINQNISENRQRFEVPNKIESDFRLIDSVGIYEDGWSGLSSQISLCSKEPLTVYFYLPAKDTVEPLKKVHCYYNGKIEEIKMLRSVEIAYGPLVPVDGNIVFHLACDKVEEANAKDPRELGVMVTRIDKGEGHHSRPFLELLAGCQENHKPKADLNFVAHQEVVFVDEYLEPETDETVSEASDTVIEENFEQVDNSFLEELIEYGLFDESFYFSQYAQELSDSNENLNGISMLQYYLEHGERLGHKPNYYFDPSWYVKEYLSEYPNGGVLNHYLQTGERAGCNPSIYFDVAWFRENYDKDNEIENYLAYFLANRSRLNLSPNPIFDASEYLEANLDIKNAKMDPFFHYAEFGVFEHRRGITKIDPAYVRKSYLNDDSSLNPIKLFLEYGKKFNWLPLPDLNKKTVFTEIKKFSSAGEHFESFSPMKSKLNPLTKVIAFYLPQFHPIPENDKWWGAGFTEWRNLVRGTPRFEGHYQPRVPRDLGFYELNGTDVMRKQVKLAKEAGVHGFCFYYYNFNGKRLLEKPLDDFVNDSEIDYPFSILWANENWTRRWDGMDKDVLIGQDYKIEDAPDLVDDLAKYLKHKNYIKADGRPVLYVYRVDIIPHCKETLALWRKLFKERHQIEPLIVMAQAFGHLDPTLFGFDGAIEFPPHKLGNRVPTANHEIEFFDRLYKGHSIRYKDVIAASLDDIGKNDFPLIKTAFPSWDNDARKQGAEGQLSFFESTPELFENWLKALCSNSIRDKFYKESFVFINAWNEWCEGAYLEPDCHFGYGYLNAVARAIERPSVSSIPRLKEVILVGHDAFPSGAQMLLLNIGKTLKKEFGLRVQFILLGGGALLPEYEKVSDTLVVENSSEDYNEFAKCLLNLKSKGFKSVITNSVVSGKIVKKIKDAGLYVVSLIHELTETITSYNLEGSWSLIRDFSDKVVFPNNYVAREVQTAFGTVSGDRAVIRHQGQYNKFEKPKSGDKSIHTKLGLKAKDRIILNVGFGDHRKGVDLFMLVADLVAQERDDVHFVWLGNQHLHFHAWIKREVERRGLKNLHFVSHSTDVGSYYHSANLLFLPSREDPFPSVVMEALSAGVEVLSFDWGGGYVELLSRDEKLGSVTPYLDPHSAATKIIEIINDPKRRTKALQDYRSKFIADNFDWAEYCKDLATFAAPKTKNVSVIVPNYNYADYITQRLDTIFSQDYPIFETIVLDDKSKDNSLEVISEYIKETQFDIQVIENKTNSGSGYHQWNKGAKLAKGDFVWIAEADDLSDSSFISKALNLLSDPEVGFVFSDSAQIDENDRNVGNSYRNYIDVKRDGQFDHDFVMDGKEFVANYLSVKNVILNVSGVLWRKDALLKVLKATEDKHGKMRVACDWLMYAKAGIMGYKIGYIAEPLNIHRRHSTSVTHSRNPELHLQEILDVQDYIGENIEKNSELDKEKEIFLKNVSEYLINAQ